MDEKQLIDRAKEGDQEAFGALLLSCEQKAYGICVSILKDQAIASDILQEARIKAFSKLEQFEQKSSFSTWFCTICKHQACSFLRKTKEFSLTFDPATPSETLSDTFDELIEKLSLKHKEIVTLYYQQGLTQKEIASKLALPYGTVRSRLHYAKAHIKKRQQKKF